jgi:L-aspartate oxidase
LSVDLRADFLIIGSGIAGLRAAAELAGAGSVLILTKADPREGNTGYAQGGIAAAVGPDDSPELHAADTMAAGDGLCDRRAVDVLVGEGPTYVRELMAWGAKFDRDADGSPALAIEGAHSARRVLHARDATGREIGRVLWRRASALPDVRTSDHARAVELVIEGEGEDARCVGVRVLSEDGSTSIARANLVLLATGGAGHVFSDTTNPPVATGDGLAMAYRAGATVSDLEFVQFHPTALRVAGQPRFLLSEALRGEGARLVNADGDAFMLRYDPAGDLAPRDRVARALEKESRRTGQPVYLSLAHLDPDFVHDRFPLISQACRGAGLDLARDRIPVGPAAHYIMGGVQTDLDGRTSIAGLFAAGEVACTGVHGANRLASNSLLEGLVFGARAGRAMRGSRGSKGPEGSQGSRDSRGSKGSLGSEGSMLAAEIQALMWRDVGLFRNRTGLASALARLEPAWQEMDANLRGGEPLDTAGWRAASLLTVGRLIARAALRREESRGGHYREDHPMRDDVHWQRRISESLATDPSDAATQAADNTDNTESV